jgi:hypothetical protein
VKEILLRGNDEEIIIMNQKEVEEMKIFAENIVNWVFTDYPDYMGKDEDINADAEKAVFIISNVLSDYKKNTGKI